MQAAGYKIPDQNTAADFLQKILSRQCKTHREYACEYLHLKTSELSPRLCFQCIDKREIPLNEVISVKELLLATSNATFKSYPKFSDSSITQKIQDLKGSKDRIGTDLSSFFDSLHSAVTQAIEKTKNTQKQKLSQLSNSYQGIFNSLSQISKIEQFQEIVKNSNDNEDNLKGFIQAQYSQMNNYTEMIKNKVHEYEMIQGSFSLIDANNTFREIMRLIEGITLFPVKANNQQQSQQPLQQLLNQQQQSVQQQQLPAFQPPQKLLEQEQQQQQKPQNNLREQSQREKEQKKLKNQPSSSKDVFEYFISLIKECKEQNIYIIYNIDDDNNIIIYNIDDDNNIDIYDIINDINNIDYYNYAYDRWKNLSEESRQKALSYLKQKLNFTD